MAATIAIVCMLPVKLKGKTNRTLGTHGPLMCSELQTLSRAARTMNTVAIRLLRVHATIARLRAFQLENTLGRSSETGVTLGIDS